MIRRALMLVAAAALLVLTPSVAIAAPSYAAPGFTVTVTDSTPASGQCTTLKVDGGAANAGKVFTLNVAGASTTSLTATSSSSGVASFQVCLTKVGDYTLTVTNPDGAVVATQTITVHAATAGGDDTSTGDLSQTGSNVLPIALGGVLLVLLGAGAVVVARRRREPAMHN
jgi:LPXTG-motif cell wall-anchored protein